MKVISSWDEYAGGIVGCHENRRNRNHRNYVNRLVRKLLQPRILRKPRMSSRMSFRLKAHGTRSGWGLEHGSRVRVRAEMNPNTRFIISKISILSQIACGISRTSFPDNAFQSTIDNGHKLNTTSSRKSADSSKFSVITSSFRADRSSRDPRFSKRTFSVCGSSLKVGQLSLLGSSR